MSIRWLGSAPDPSAEGALALTRGLAEEDVAGADVLIEVGLVHAVAARDEAPVVKFLGRPVQEPERPSKGGGDPPAIPHLGDELVLGHRDATDRRS